MNPVWVAGLILAALIWVSWDDTRARPVVVDLAAAEQDVALRVVNPRLRQFDADGALKSTMTAPEALDFGGSRPGQITQPALTWPLSGWQAESTIGETYPDRTLLKGDATATHAAERRTLNADQIEYQGDVMTATGNAKIHAPDFTARAGQVRIETTTDTIELTQQVTTTLWPAR